LIFKNSRKLGYFEGWSTFLSFDNTIKNFSSFFLLTTFCCLPPRCGQACEMSSFVYEVNLPRYTFLLNALGIQLVNSSNSPKRARGFLFLNSFVKNDFPAG